ncbi:MAG: hypothetical protein ACI9R3_000889 [Verrucomicrobiales bacterium]|jgi:hypothetical protein
MWIIFGVWAIFCVWVIGACSRYGFMEPESEVQLVIGMPAWVFWGVAVPWCGATLFSIVFALFFMSDHELGGEGS